MGARKGGCVDSMFGDSKPGYTYHGNSALKTTLLLSLSFSTLLHVHTHPSVSLTVHDHFLLFTKQQQQSLHKFHFLKLTSRDTRMPSKKKITDTANQNHHQPLENKKSVVKSNMCHCINSGPLPKAAIESS